MKMWQYFPVITPKKSATSYSSSPLNSLWPPRADVWILRLLCSSFYAGRTLSNVEHHRVWYRILPPSSRDLTCQWISNRYWAPGLKIIIRLSKSGIQTAVGWDSSDTLISAGAKTFVTGRSTLYFVLAFVRICYLFWVYAPGLVPVYRNLWLWITRNLEKKKQVILLPDETMSIDRISSQISSSWDLFLCLSKRTSETKMFLVQVYVFISSATLG